MNKFSPHVNNVIFLLFAVAIYIGMMLFSYKYEMNPYLWFDDAGQFWISQGLNHDSAPLSPSGNLVDVLVNNAGYNFDPGGYSVILHYWSMISTNYIWLRSLSFSFFLLSVFLFGYLAFLWSKSVNVGIVAGFIPFVIPMVYYAGFYIRAYSMEVCGCLVCILALHFLQNKLSYKRLLIWSSIIAFFMTSRYSFIVVAFVTSLYVLYIIRNSNNIDKVKIKMAISYAMPLIMVLILIYCTSLRYQNPELKSLSYLNYISDDWKVILNRASLRHLLCLFIITDIYIRQKNNSVLMPYKGLIFVTISANVLFFLFSCFGMHPWHGGSCRCISMIMLVIISFTALCCELIKVVNKLIDIQYIIVLVVLLILFEYKDDISSSKYRGDVLSDWGSVVLNDNSKVFVDHWETPCLRYQLEYGMLKNTPNYPDNFTFTTYVKHSFVNKDSTMSIKEWYEKTQPYLNDLYEEYDVLVVPDLYSYKPYNSDKWRSINNNEIIWVKK